MKEISSVRVFNGDLKVFEHDSRACKSPMRFSIYIPDERLEGACIYWISGLTCNEHNFFQKSGACKYLCELGIVLVAPDTSPRGSGIADDETKYYLGQGASFYVNAIKEPWSENYKMCEYVQNELPALVQEHFAVKKSRQSIMGHSMGGHGALLAALQKHHQYVSASAFAPIAQASKSQWGECAFSHYLGEDRKLWDCYDVCSVYKSCGSQLPILIDQGSADEFLLSGQLQIDALQRLVCGDKNVSIRIREGYDHSFYFISTFIEDHIRFHGQHLLEQQ